MSNDNRKILTTSFVIGGFLVFIVLSLLLETLATMSPLLSRYVSSDVIRHGVPIALGFITFGLLQFNKKVVSFCDEVITEIQKIVWPSKKDTIAMTIVVCVMLLISATFLMLIDAASGVVVKWMISQS